MIYLNAFLCAGIICLIGQIILDNTKFTPGHITALFVVVGSFLDTFSIYDKIVKWAGGGALVPITSFGHLLSHGSFANIKTDGIFSLFMGMFDLTSSGIVAAIIFSFTFALIFKAKD